MSNSNRNNTTATKKQKSFFRNTRDGILPSSIDVFRQLIVEPAMKVALNTASVKLVVEIDSSGTSVFLADQRTGQMVGGPEDLSKLGGIRSFVTRERKETLGVEIARQIAAITYRASLVGAAWDTNYQQKKLDNSFGALVRPLLIVLDRLEQNRKKLMENTNPELATIYKPILVDQFKRIKNTYFRYIVSVVKGENEKGQLQELLLQGGIPDWIHSRFTAQTFLLDRNQELARVLFPSDPSKGLALSVKEWADENIHRALGKDILGKSGILLSLIKDERFLRAITNLDADVSLTDETNTAVAKLLRTKLAVIPSMGNSRYVTEPGAKARAGWKFPSPTMDTPSGAIAAVGTVFLRIYSANLQTVDLVSDFYANIVPGAVKRSEVSPTNNFYVQWGNAKNPTDVWLQCLSECLETKHRENMYRWIRTELRLSEKGAAGKALLNAFRPEPKSDDAGSSSPSPDLIQRISPIVFAEHANMPVKDTLPDLLKPLTEVEKPLVEIFQGETFQKKKGKATVDTGLKLTVLSKEGRELTRRLERVSPDLAARMSSWLRGFSEDRLQRAAIRLANASFDEMFVREDELDHNSDEEGDDTESYENEDS